MSTETPQSSEIPTDWLWRAAESAPDRVALRDGEGKAVTFRELVLEAGGVAQWLCAEGEDGVLLEMEPGVDWAVGLHGAMLAGRAAQTLRPGLPDGERDRTLRGRGADVVAGAEVVSGCRASVAGRYTSVIRGPVEPQDVLSRVLSSGTTGEPRIIEHTYGNHWASAQASAANLGTNPDDVWLCCLPVDHVGGLTIPIRSVIYGTCAEIHPGFDVDRVAASLARDVTLVSLVPTQLLRLLDADADLRGPRVVLIGGAPLSPDLLHEALQREVSVVQTYGLTEACSQVCTLAPGEAAAHPGSSGRPLPGIEVEIAEDGEILVRGGNVAPGAIAADGWLHTGDLGRLDEEGYLYVEGRADDLIVTGGENVRPEEVETALESHPAVAEAAVVGTPDPEWGQAVTAVVVLSPEMRAGEDDLRAHCRKSLASHKVPKSVRFASSLPRTRSGKLRRKLLR